ITIDRAFFQSERCVAGQRLAATRWRFGARRMRHVNGVSDRQFLRAILVAALFCGTAANGAIATPCRLPKLKTGTAAAFDRYVALTEERNSTELKSGAPFLWPDTLAEDERRAAYESLRAGATRIEKRQMFSGGNEIRCPNG